jgi:hypothetical protein
VPADHRFGRDDDQGLLPARLDPPSKDPEEPVKGAKARSRMPTLQHGELLGQGEIHKQEAPTHPQEANQRSEAEGEESQHGGEL